MDTMTPEAAEALNSPATLESVTPVSKETQLQNLRDKLIQSGKEAQSTNNFNEKNTILDHALANTIAHTIALTVDQPDKVETIKDIAETIMQEASENFIKRDFEIARSYTEVAVLNHIKRIADIVGLQNINMADLLERVDIRDMFPILNKYIPKLANEFDPSLLETQAILQTIQLKDMRPDDTFEYLVRKLDTLPKNKEPLTADESKFIEILLQLSDATYSLSILNDVAHPDIFNPESLDVYPNSIKDFYNEMLPTPKDARVSPKQARVLDAFNMIKSCKTREGRSLLDLGRDRIVAMTWEQIKRQQDLSKTITDLLGPKIAEAYPTSSGQAHDMGSFNRGTNVAVDNGKDNNTNVADCDVIVTNIPSLSETGLDWKNVDTYMRIDEAGNRKGVPEGIVVGKLNEIKNIDDIKKMDPKVAITIEACTQALETKFKNVQFNYLKCSGEEIVLFFKAGHIDIDINLGLVEGHFGLTHTQRFNKYIEDIKHEYSEEKALQLINDIRWFKHNLELNALDDKSRRVAGIWAEALFMSGKLRTRDEVIQMLNEYMESHSDNNREENIHTQTEQLIGVLGQEDEGWLDKLMYAAVLDQGGYENVKEIVQHYRPKLLVAA